MRATNPDAESVVCYMVKAVTLKDIAADLNISRTTVHRALSGKEGISEALREQILARAGELGYTANYVASSLKRKTICLGVVLPEKEGNGRFYHRYFWDAVEEFVPEAKKLNVSIQFYSFDEQTDEQHKLLENLFHNCSEEIDGLLVMPAKCNESTSRILERFSDKGIPVVLIDNDLPDCGRLCCVAPHNRLTGRLGAEMLSSLLPAGGKILVTCGEVGSLSHQHNLEGFKEYLAETGHQYPLIEVRNYGHYNKCYEQCAQFLQQQTDIAGFYSVTARDTIPLTQAVIDCGLQGTLRGVGSDLFPESAEMLRNNALQALLYKNAYDKGRLGLELLFSHVVKGTHPHTDTFSVPISIIMKNNLPFFEERI